MRSRQEVEARVRYLVNEELVRRLAEIEQCQPHHCKHNYRHPLDTRRRIGETANPNYNRIALAGEATIGLCMLGSEDVVSWPGTICEDVEMALACPYYTSKTTRGDVLTTYRDQLQDLAWLEQNLPQVFELVWVLQAVSAPTLTWWQSLILVWRTRRSKWLRAVSRRLSLQRLGE
jgi:hypothetical protein